MQMELMMKGLQPETQCTFICKFTKAVGILILTIVAVQLGVVLFGALFDADTIAIKDTSAAKEKLGKTLYAVFKDYGRFDVRLDHSVRAYISRTKYMSIAYPDREAAITKVGKAWCEDKGVNIFYLPKVQIRDIETGDVLGTYRCFFNFVSKQ